MRGSLDTHEAHRRLSARVPLALTERLEMVGSKLEKVMPDDSTHYQEAGSHCLGRVDRSKEGTLGAQTDSGATRTADCSSWSPVWFEVRKTIAKWVSNR